MDGKAISSVALTAFIVAVCPIDSLLRDLQL